MKNWSGGRNAYQDMSGEYVPCAGCTYERTLFLSETMMWCAGFYCYTVRISAHVAVDDSRRKFQCWAESSFGCGANRVPVVSGRCRSIRDALHKANAAIVERDAMRLALVASYRSPLLVADTDGVPFVSLFTRDYFILPEGNWVARHSDGYLEHISRHGGSYGTRGQRETTVR